MIRDSGASSPGHRPLIAPTCSLYPALDAGGILSIALVAIGPDVDAFTGGLVLGISAAFVFLAIFGGLSVVRRILGS